MKVALVAVLTLLITACNTNVSTFTPQNGDLFFQDIDCGEYCDAIEKVTVGFNGCKTSHVGIFLLKNDTPMIIEARSTGVVLTSLDSFLQRNVDPEGKPKVYVGRVNSLKQAGWEVIRERLLGLLGKPYDHVYIPNDGKYYCSELVQETFVLNNHPIFQLEPMTFKDPETGQVFENWDAYFAQLGVPVPEGKSGINPGGISRSEDVTIVHFYGLPDGCHSSK